MKDQELYTDEITLKHLIIKVKEYLAELWVNKFWIILIAVPFVLYFGYNAIIKPPIFSAERKFFLEEGSGGASMGSLGGLLGQFGVKGGKSNYSSQIIEVANSKILLSEALFEGDVKNNLANSILKIYQLPEKWSEDKKEYANFTFNHSRLDSLSNLESKVLNKLISFLSNSKDGPPIQKISFNEEEGIFSIETKSISTDLSLKLNEIIYDKLRYYFEEKVMVTQKETRDLLKLKLDSLNNLISQKTYKIARINDQNNGRIYQTDVVPTELLRREISALSMAQAEVFKTYEMADYSYKNKQQIFMLVDRPFPPLSADVPNKTIEIIKGLILGLFLAILFFLTRKIYLDALREE